ncbi:uncharacterized protein LOC135696150 [Rhopilema esculentum]|uniref:uncharacterized protein LOC135696150 n=1 Tax=Rhopilema esculentum TaxID=499914 RepID=UPI0031CEFEE9
MAAYTATHEKSVLPKSLDDAKIAKTQRATHTDILELGHKIFQKNSASQRDIFNEEISKLRDDLLKKAKEEKEALLSEAREKAHEDLREAMAEAKKEQERLVKEEAKRVKEVMKQIANQRVEQERNEGEERLRNALKKKKAECDKEKEKAIMTSRQEEQDKAKQMLNDLTEQHKIKEERLYQEFKKEKQAALEQLEVQWIEKKNWAVEETRKEAEKKADAEKSRLNLIHNEEINEKLDEIQQLKREYEKLLFEIQLEKTSHDKTAERLHFVAQSFQSFIDSQPGFAKGQSDFLLKDFLTESIDK